MTTDARTFTEIWNSLGSTEQYALRDKIMTKTGASPSLFWFWKLGKSRPASRTDRRAIARTVSDFIGIQVHEATLFPRKR